MCAFSIVLTRFLFLCLNSTRPETIWRFKNHLYFFLNTHAVIYSTLFEHIFLKEPIYVIRIKLVMSFCGFFACADKETAK